MNNTLIKTKPVLFHLITGFSVGGAERVLSRVLPRLNRYKHVVISLRDDGPMGEVFRQLHLTTAMLNMANMVDVRALWNFRKLVRRYRPVALTTYLIHADVVGRIFGHLVGIPIIVCSLRARFRSFKVNNLLRIAKLFDSWVDHYIAVSEEVRRYYVDDLGYPARKFTVITNGLPIEEWGIRLEPTFNQNLRESLGLPLGAFLIGTVTQLRPEKGVKRLLEAMNKLIVTEPDIHCVIIGDGTEREYLRNYVKQQGLTERVHFLGNRHDVKDVIRLLDIFILPSLFEGMSNALLEAMASSRPIIATDTPENREVIVPSSGLLIDTANPEVLANAVAVLLHNDNRRKILGQAARQRLEKFFSLDSKIGQLDQLYTSLIKLS